MTDRYQPMQPIETDGNGVRRFRKNAIVSYLLDNGGIDLNQLACIGFPQSDRDQFTQLIGYSVSAAPISAELQSAADSVVEENKDTDRARIAYLEGRLAEVKGALRGPVADLFNVHPDDLA